MSEAIQGHALIVSLRMASFCLLPRTLASLGRVQELKYGTWHEMRYKEFISDSQFKLFPQTEAVWNTVPQECLSSEKAILRQHDSDQQCTYTPYRCLHQDHGQCTIRISWLLDAVNPCLCCWIFLPEREEHLRKALRSRHIEFGACWYG